MEQIERPPERLPDQSADEYIDELVGYLNRFWEASYKGGAASFRNIKTGTYTGDGSTGQAITGVGFRPKFVWIWTHPTAEANMEHHIKIDQTWGDYACQMVNASAQDIRDNKINSLNADGFTVDDDSADLHPNKNTQVYDFLAIG